MTGPVLSFRRAAWLVARREFRERLRDRSFAVSTAVTVGIIALFVLVPRFVDLGDSYDVAFLADDGSLQEAVERQTAIADVEVTVADVADAASADRSLLDGELDAYVSDGTVVAEQTLAAPLRSVLENAYRQVEGAAALADAGIDPTAAAAALDSARLRTVTLDPEAEDRDTRVLIAFAGAMVLFGQLIGYSMWVATGVVEEKSSRVVEVVLSAIPARALLAGKVLGIGALGLVQLVLIAVLALGLAGGSGAVDMTADLVGPVLVSLGWFVPGFAAYASLAAAAAARVSRQEEVQNVTTPLTMTAMISYFAAFYTYMQPHDSAAEVLSVVPPLSALVMPIRMASGDANGWQVALALGLMVLLILALVAFAARIYEGAVLRMGSKVSVRDALAGGGRRRPGR